MLNPQEESPQQQEDKKVIQITDDEDSPSSSENKNDTKQTPTNGKASWNFMMTKKPGPMISKDVKEDSYGNDAMNTSLSLEGPPTHEPDIKGKQKEKTTKPRWTQDEDRKVIEAVNKHKEDLKGKQIDWAVVAKLTGLDRSKDRIRARYRKIEKTPQNSPVRPTRGHEDDHVLPEAKRVKMEAEEIVTENTMSIVNFLERPVSGPMRDATTQMEDTEKLNIEEILREHTAYKKKSEELEHQVKDIQSKIGKELTDLLKSRAILERNQRRQDIRQDSQRLGQILYQRRGVDVYEEWQDGYAFEQIDYKLKLNEIDKEKYEKLKKNMQKSKTSAKKQDFQDDSQFRLYNEQEEIYKLRLSVLKKEETALRDEKDRLLLEKTILVRKLKLDREEEKSQFNNFPLIGDRYLLLHLLGKGGFSEVYKAYDLLDMQVVACKIHQLSPHWPEKRKVTYIRHVLRECEIQQSIKHPRIVRMYNSFSHGNDIYVTVMEYCDGNDLDLYLKQNGTIPEKEAKLIMSQVFAGLKYLNEQNRKIIHYDLKPANILFGDDGGVKLTDFGLSKVMEEDTENSIELTSQGAGTYWYLPPECFDTSKTPKISSKVDVWSAGVVFYQLLYGQKPFGNDQTQQKILQSGTILMATDVQFPPKPSVSEETKKFIAKCLTPSPDVRPDVMSCFTDKYWGGSIKAKTEQKDMGPPK